MIHRIAITPGEPAGIGPDILIALAQHHHDHELVAVADPDLLKARAATLGLPLHVRELELDQPPRGVLPGELVVAPIPLIEPSHPGRLNPANAAYVLATLDHAIELCQQNRCQALVTGPVHKGVINDAAANNGLLAGEKFHGHTEYLAKACQRDKVVMMLATQKMRVALVTTHLPLREVADAITAETLRQTIEILQRDLQNDFGLSQPRILVCGLNPHAGEGGHLGREEIDTINPTLEKLRQRGFNLIGPLPADTLFTPKVLAQGDAVLAMYHDQGLPVLKYQGFGKAVNITLGLPIIRTSVDHGTALDLAGTGKADSGSLQTALDYAISLVNTRQKQTANANSPVS